MSASLWSKEAWILHGSFLVLETVPADWLGRGWSHPGNTVRVLSHRFGGSNASLHDSWLWVMLSTITQVCLAVDELQRKSILAWLKAALALSSTPLFGFVTFTGLTPAHLFYGCLNEFLNYKSCHLSLSLKRQHFPLSTGCSPISLAWHLSCLLTSSFSAHLSFHLLSRLLLFL